MCPPPLFGGASSSPTPAPVFPLGAPKLSLSFSTARLVLPNTRTGCCSPQDKKEVRKDRWLFSPRVRKTSSN